MDEANIGIIILAAGASTRFGEPKQLLEFQNKTLISKAAESATNSNCSKIVVVLGANAEVIEQEIEDFSIGICINQDWQTGMASSIKCGLEELLARYSHLDAVIILLCDQPFIETKHINLLIGKYEQTSCDIVVAKYKNLFGVPALFSKKMFSELLQIKGDKGARQIITRFVDSTATVEIPEAEFDIDTVEDYKKLSESE